MARRNSPKAALAEIDGGLRALLVVVLIACQVGWRSRRRQSRCATPSDGASPAPRSARSAQAAPPSSSSPSPTLKVSTLSFNQYAPPRSASAIEPFNGRASRSARPKPARAVARAKRRPLGDKVLANKPPPTPARRASKPRLRSKVARVSKTLTDEIIEASPTHKRNATEFPEGPSRKQAAAADDDLARAPPSY